jgi:type I restriction enzyme S subunit
MNKTLEEIGQVIFKRWFVDFEFPNEQGKPYKSSGGKMIDSDLGKIPEGWEVKNFNEVASIEYGKGQSSKEDIGSYPVYGAGGRIGFSDSFTNENEELIVGCRGTCGNLTITEPFSVISHNSLVLKPKDQNGFDIYSLKLALEFNQVESVITGSTQPQITINDLSKLQIIMPNETILRKFNVATKEINTLLFVNIRETRFLEGVRDLLLPKLMTGKIRVK